VLKQAEKTFSEVMHFLQLLDKSLITHSYVTSSSFPRSSLVNSSQAANKVLRGIYWESFDDILTNGRVARSKPVQICKYTLK